MVSRRKKERGVPHSTTRQEIILGHDKNAAGGIVRFEEGVAGSTTSGRNKYSHYIPQWHTVYSVYCSEAEIEVLCADSSKVVSVSGDISPSSVTVVPTHVSSPGDTHNDISAVLHDLTIYYQNVRGLRSKLVSLRQSLSNSNFKIFSLTETWLNTSFRSSELGFVNCNIFRHEKNTQTSVHLRGGGVLVACDSKLNAILLKTDEPTIEHIFIKFVYKSTTYVLGTFYIPPNSNIITYINACKLIGNISNSFPTATLCIVGDFNMPFVSWKTVFDGGPSCVPKTNSSRLHNQIAIQMSNTLDFLAINQFNTFVNIAKNILELILCNSPIHSLELVNDPILKIDKFHPPLILTMSTNCLTNTDNSFNVQHSKYDFEKADMAGVHMYLSNIDWIALLTGTSNIDDAVTIFYDTMYYTLSLFIPSKKN